MINVSNPLLYADALVELEQYKRTIGRSYRGRFVQIFLALKFYQNQIPSMFSNQFVSTEVLQTLLDDLYAKASQPLNDCVLMLFENRYHARTGLRAPGNITPQNTWRNNFHLQKGIGCYAGPQDLSSLVFLNQSRVNCLYLQPEQVGTLSRATCQLCPRSASYRNEDHRKWLRIDPGGSGFATVDLLNTDNFLPYVAPDQRRIPVLPLVVALYHELLPGLAISGRDELDLSDFAADFNISGEEFQVYFDDAPSNTHNRRLLRRFSDISYTQITSECVIQRDPMRRARRVVRRPLHNLSPVLSGTPTTPPGVNTGWEAEQFVKKALEDIQCQVYDVSRQRLGYDLLVQKSRATWYVDVKSSLSYSSPSLTQREWQQARIYEERYILAIIENFNPRAENVIYWVPDPYRDCGARETTVVQYYITRSSWIPLVVPLSAIVATN